MVCTKKTLGYMAIGKEQVHYLDRQGVESKTGFLEKNMIFKLI